MQSNIIGLSEHLFDKNYTQEQQAGHFGHVLKQYNLAFKLVDFYLQVGEITIQQGWLINISVVRWQIRELLDAVIPVLVSENIPFKIPQDQETANSLLDGNLGLGRVGKILTAFPENEEKAVSIAQKLSVLTEKFKGPCIVTDIHLGGTVYTRYGAFTHALTEDISYGSRKDVQITDKYFITNTPTTALHLPHGVFWPFNSITPVKDRKKNKLLSRRYKPISVLKHDPKGNVVKALYLHRFINIKYCVIKQGRKNMWSDEHGRDIQDRLIWQKELHDDVAGDVLVPKILDFFYDDGDAYLVMEFIKGKSLYDKLLLINKNCCSWKELPIENNLILLDYLLQITNIIQNLHNKGYIHRDINPVNFMITPINSLVLIDNELAYSVISKRPNPPFVFGTPGFVSPEQNENQIPTEKEDIYGFGALMLMALLTGVSPLTFDTHVSVLLRKQLKFFIYDCSVTDLIVNCLHCNPALRPSLTSIRSTIQIYRDSLLVNSKNNDEQNPSPDLNLLSELIEGALKGLVMPPTVLSADLWQSRTPYSDDIPCMEQSEFSKSDGLHEGITGVLFLLSEIHQLGFDITACQKSYNKGWEYINNKYSSNVLNTRPGLYSGAAGVALAIASGIKGGLLADTEENRLSIRRCLNIQANDLSLANGVAGQCIAVIKCKSYFEEESFRELLQKLLKNLLAAQQRNGRWQLTSPPGLAFGQTGITCALLNFCSLYQNEHVQGSVLRSLNSLLKQARLIEQFIRKNGCITFINGGRQIGDVVIGIVYCFMKAYELFKIDDYKTISERIIRALPDHILSDNFSLDNGLAGLGEMYLEAARIFENNDWKRRADWIVNTFQHTKRVNTNGAYYWSGSNRKHVTADLFVGNSGIIHFLSRYLEPQRLAHPVIL